MCLIQPVWEDIFALILSQLLFLKSGSASFGETFSLFLSSSSGVQRILGYVWHRRIVAVDPSKTGKLWAAFWGAFRLGQPFAQCSDLIGLQMRPLKDADPEFRHSKRVK